MHSSPTKRMFGRRTQTLIPLSPSLLQPACPTNHGLKTATQSEGEAGTVVQLQEQTPQPAAPRKRCMNEASQWDVRSQCRPMDPCTSYQVHGPSLLPGRVLRFNVSPELPPAAPYTEAEPDPIWAGGAAATLSKEAHNLSHHPMTQSIVLNHVSHACHKLQSSLQEAPSVEATVTPLRRSSRTATLPAHYKDFLLY